MAKSEREIIRDFGAEITNCINRIDALYSEKNNSYLDKPYISIDTTILDDEIATCKADLLKLVKSYSEYIQIDIPTKGLSTSELQTMNILDDAK